ncbi:MAG: hypothetical protein RSD40_06540 [Bacilli bacterium]
MGKKAQEIGLTKDGAYRELEALAKANGKSIREIVMDESGESFNVVVEIFYKNLPKLAQWSMNREKFRDFFLKNREIMLSKAGL